MLLAEPCHGAVVVARLANVANIALVRDSDWSTVAVDVTVTCVRLTSVAKLITVWPPLSTE